MILGYGQTGSKPALRHRGLVALLANPDILEIRSSFGNSAVGAGSGCLHPSTLCRPGAFNYALSFKGR